MATSIMPMPSEMQRSLPKPQQTQEQRRRVAAATKAAAARWAADAEAEESPLSWWTASVAEVEALEKLIGSRVKKATDRLGETPDTAAVEELSLPPSSDSPDVILALRNAAMPLEQTTRANDITVLREEFGRLAAQVRIQEGRFGPWSAALENDVAELRATIGGIKEQMEGRSYEQKYHSTVREPQSELLEPIQENLSLSFGAASDREVLREIDDLRERCAALTGVVEDVARKVAEETTTAIADVAGAVQQEVKQLRQTQGEMLQEMAAFRSRPESFASNGILTEVSANFADAIGRLEMVCKTAHDAVSQHREEHRAKHDDIMAKIETSELNFAELKSRFEGLFSQDRPCSPKSHISVADKTDSPGPYLSLAARQDLESLRADMERSLKSFHEDKASMLIVETPRGQVALSSLPGELEELKTQLERVVGELREEKDAVTERALVAVENSRLEHLLPSSLQSFREEIEAAICEIRQDVSKVETSCVENILPASLKMFRDEIETVVGSLCESISSNTERIQTQHLQFQQTTPRLAADVDAIKVELRSLQEDRSLQQSALDEGVVSIAKLIADLRNELSDAREVSISVEKLHGVLEQSVANFDFARAATLSDSQARTKARADFDQAQAEKVMNMAARLGDRCVRDIGIVDVAANDEVRMNLYRLAGVVDELVLRETQGPAVEAKTDAVQVSVALDRLRMQCQDLVTSIQVPSDLQLQVSELNTRVDEIVEGGADASETQKIALTDLQNSRTALETMVELLNKSGTLSLAVGDATSETQQVGAQTSLDDLHRSSPSRPADVPALQIESAFPRSLPLEVTSSLQLPANQAGVEELWVALGGRSLAEQVQALRRGQVSPRRWEELREQHAELSRMVAMLQDMHCHHVRALWEDLRAVCRELTSISEASEVASAQAAAAQAAGVGAAATQAVTLWEELGTPRRAELVGMIGEVRSLRVEVDRLRAVKEDAAVAVFEDAPLQKFTAGDETLRSSHGSRRGSWRRPSQEQTEEIVTLTSPAETASVSSKEEGHPSARGRRLSPKVVDRRRPSSRQSQSTQQSQEHAADEQ
mmetsp:Transcript_51703/g.80721  ORF Transcript_51703/g.80721 Transcript_51703/m.80721 type:complete len:1061 (-) Transcript_51703:71-3253(-)